MNDAVTTHDTANRGAPESGSPALGMSAGAMLRSAREAAGLHIGALAVALKVPVRKLEDLEADRWDALPDIAFVRALASSVCRMLRVDAAPILQQLPANTVPRLAPQGDRLNAPYHPPGIVTSRGTASPISRPVLVAVAVLLLGALALYFFPVPPNGGVTVGERTQVVTTAPSNAPAAVPTAVTPVASGAAAPVSEAALSAQSDASVPVGALALEASREMSTRGLVVFKAHGDTWVEVKDAQGDITLRKVLASGEAVGASGKLPLSVVVGRADVTQVLVRGEAIDLSAMAKVNNVARFEVK